jgi:pimeloyl-ACP methyl ester carboxylesterase
VPILELEQNLNLYYTIDDHTDPWRQPETVVFVHGFAESTEAWRTWMPHFSRRYRAVRFDQRGFGRSGPVAADFAFSTELLVRDLSHLIEAVSPGKPVHLVGWKSAAITTTKLAIARPDLVKTITLISPALKGPETVGWLDRIEQEGMPGWSRWTMGARLGDMPPAGVEWWIDLMGRTASSTAFAYLRWVSGVNVEPELGKLAVPALIVGNNTARRSIADFRSHQDRIPGAELAMIEVDGYHTGVVAPDLSAAAVLDFIGRHATPDAASVY